jgi:uncharacterized membrane protein YgcG
MYKQLSFVVMLLTAFATVVLYISSETVQAQNATKNSTSAAGANMTKNTTSAAGNASSASSGGTSSSGGGGY